MAEDEGLEDAPFPEPLSALGGVPAPPRPADEPPTSANADGHVPFDDRRSFGRESRLDRLIGWVQWAAAPLGFFVFLVALTAFGLLKDEPTSDVGNTPLANVSTPTSAAAQAVAVATTVPEVPSTTAAPTTEPPTTEPPTTEPPAAQPPATEPPATEPPPEPASGSAEATSPNRAPRFGPVCGYRPGQTVRIRINGEPAPPVTADANGCVSVNR